MLIGDAFQVGLNLIGRRGLHGELGGDPLVDAAARVPHGVALERLAELASELLAHLDQFRNVDDVAGPQQRGHGGHQVVRAGLAVREEGHALGQQLAVESQYLARFDGAVVSNQSLGLDAGLFFLGRGFGEELGDLADLLLHQGGLFVVEDLEAGHGHLQLGLQFVGVVRREQGHVAIMY